MNKDIKTIKAHYGNPYPFWVQEPDANGVFPPNMLAENESIEIPVSVRNGKVVEGNILGVGSYTGEMTTDSDYIAYVPPHAFGKDCHCLQCDIAAGIE